MGFAYRDDLEAARLRVLDLEREHAALAAHNARLEAVAAPTPAPPAAVHVHRRRGSLTTGELTVFYVVVFGFLGLYMLAGWPSHALKPAGDAIALSTLGAIHLRRWMQKE